MRQLGIALGHGPAGDGVGRAAVRAARPPAAHRQPRRRAAAAARARAGWSSTASPSPTSTRRRRRCATSTSTSRPGTTVALVGGTGAGKTTLVQLLPRLYDVDGRRRADRRRRRARGRPRLAARAPSPSSTDDPFLFSATVARQHRLRRGRTPPARRSSARPSARRPPGFVAELPEGYDTRIGERGLTLSGGQRQRIAIARALLADPRILVLDDATSSVDASTEQAIKARAARGDGRAHDVRHRPPALHHRARRRDRRARGRARSRRAARTTSCWSAPRSTRRSRRKGLPDQVFLTREMRSAKAVA